MLVWYESIPQSRPNSNNNNNNNTATTTTHQSLWQSRSFDNLSIKLERSGFFSENILFGSDNYFICYFYYGKFFNSDTNLKIFHNIEDNCLNLITQWFLIRVPRHTWVPWKSSRVPPIIEVNSILLVKCYSWVPPNCSLLKMDGKHCSNLR